VKLFARCQRFTLGPFACGGGPLPASALLAGPSSTSSFSRSRLRNPPTSRKARLTSPPAPLRSSSERSARSGERHNDPRLDTLSSLKVVGEDGAHDIAELSGPVISEKFEIDCAGYRSGREYLAVGYANGEYRTQFPLIYSAFGRDPESGNGMFIGADVIPGMSGGPMINGQFRVTGIVNQRWPSRSRALADTYLCGGKIA
jgi:hypothetical protein